ncbi:Asp23/Gls24 family envelope stress response protein [Sinosporangium siamense]|uniref:Asp23/Gls24 family envelope stress response protein n=1 Tax=Sinosporangium siamense TaxID=1367973 RepID=A0A919RIK9_9ACTN|nr:Asp23/Gls24 family envelope stress response protein [Sinosporangium siamense]GII92651.1 hypothetical protein Ssi02_28820 [Sinosporangium siamense]
MPAKTPAHEIADRVRQCPDVEGLSGGPFGVVATYLPGETVPGVAIRDDEVEISIVAKAGRPLPEIAGEVREAIKELTGGRAVNIHIGGLK